MLSTTDISALLAHYQIAAPRSITPARHGYVNETAFVDTERGCLVVRRCHARLGAAAAAYRHQLIAHVRAAGVPAPALLRDPAGQTFALLGGRVWEIQELLPGEDFTPGCAPEAASVGALLARYHAAAADMPPPPGPQAEPRYLPRALRGLTEQLLERDLLGELHEPLARYDARAAALERALPDTQRAALPQVVIHGDMHADNMRFQAHAAVGLLDFDQAAHDARIVDLADALVACASAPTRDPAWMWGVFSGPLERGCAAALLGGYDAQLERTPAERAALPTLLETLWLYGSLARVAATPEGAPEYHLAVLEQGLRLAAWLAAEGRAAGV